ncbi:hypothetical protein HK100_000115 [Physocladia obscura]|uniref:N-acetyltransferase domain-containing protein n=1 Tax=Physocladia obscura TaxID=109957 RepID=A0AAD5SZ91_9FUNG|nr:hypothetical protein HK100_000115 [Physocladia obscura]
MTQITIRFATKADAVGCTRIYTETWSTAYRHIVPQEYITTLNASRYQTILDSLPESSPLNSSGILTVVAECEKDIIGLAVFGSTRDPDFSKTYPLELKSLYVLPDFHGRGIAMRLIRKGADLMGWYSLDPAVAKMSCRTFEMNERAIAFYKKIGGTVVGRGIWSRPGIERVILTVGWNSVPI